jgi:hypothetical protein
MDNQGVEGLVTIVIALVAIAVGLSPVIALWIYIFYQNGKRKRIRARVLAARADVIGNKHWLPARYASAPRFDSFFKILPWEGAGILVMAPGSVLFLGETNSGTPLTLQFAPGNSRLNWLGKCPFPNGAVSWCSFDTQNEKHYFSSETGILIFGSHNSTKALYDQSNASFAAHSAPNP